MKVKELIGQLQKKNPDKQIVAAYWEYEDFKDICSAKHWPKAVEIIDRNSDWSQTHESIRDDIIDWSLDNALNE
ncbi:MAG: hypothetical protein H8E12_17105 [Rhodobacteraceae bacterium]|nr:hypothetical protein [Paracoccaceae bacterium]